MLKSGIVNIVFAILVMGSLLYDALAPLSFWWYAVIAIVYVAIQVYGSSVLAAAYFTSVKYKGDKNSNCVAITFDDGPVNGKTEEILSILGDRNVQAAFFCIGNRVEKNRSIVERIHVAGHLVCNHSYWHRSTFDLQTSRAIGTELDKTDRAIELITGRKPMFFRPPFGVTNPMVAKAIARGKYTTIGWSIRSFDTVISDSTRLLRRIKSDLKAGDIILFHDHGKVTADILPALLDHVAAVGLKIVRLDQLLKEKAYA